MVETATADEKRAVWVLERPGAVQKKNYSWGKKIPIFNEPVLPYLAGVRTFTGVHVGGGGNEAFSR